LSQLARDKLVCCEASSEESPPAKVCTKEHELYTEALQIGLASTTCPAFGRDQRKALRQQICKVDTMGIDGKNMLLPGEVFWLRVNQEEVSRGHSS
jgi:hypothetical protein